MRRWIPAAVVVLGWSGGACGAASMVPLPTLHAVRSLSNEQADGALPAVFEGTVTYFRGYEKTLFVQDGEEAIYVNATTTLDLVPGDRVLVRGVTAGSFRPIVISHDLTLLRHGTVPSPVGAAFANLIRAEMDCRYVTVQGRVRSANLVLTSGRPVTQMELGTDRGPVSVTMDSADAGSLKELLDADVEVTGVASGRFDGKMQPTGILIHSTSLASLKVLLSAPMDAWSLPITPMDQVLRDYDVEDRTARVRVQGTLTYYRPMSMAVLQDEERSIRVFTPQIDRLHIGDHVEAIGIPFVDNGFLTLKLGAIRSMGSTAAVLPKLVTWDELASGKHAFDLVSIDGAVVSQVREHAQDVYIVSDGHHLFSATVRHPYVYQWNASHDPGPMAEIRPGSQVRITGVAILDDGNPFNGAMAFGILLRTSSDVVVLARPPLLDVRNLQLVAGILLALVFVVVMRGWSLERRVRGEMAVAATVERRRSAVLEDMNRSRPLAEILEKITGLLSYTLHGAPCWCKLVDGTVIGRSPAQRTLARMKIIQQPIPSHTGQKLGTIFSAPGRWNQARCSGDALFNAAQLAALAIETNGLYADLVHRSEFDLLTDVHNRFSLEKQLDRMIEGERAQDNTFGLIYIDLDDFKLVNDRYGHHVGDLYLQELALRMKTQLRPADMLARLGGDEFAALVQQVHGRPEVAEIAQRLERCFEEPFVLGGYMLRGTASLGIAVYPHDGTSRDSLLNAADAAMYVEKNNHQGVVRTLAVEPA